MDTTRLRIASDADIVGTVPYLIGYHPRRSITLLTIGRGERQTSGPLVTIPLLDFTDDEVRAELVGTVGTVDRLGMGVYGMVLHLDGPLSETFHRRSTREFVRAVREADDPRVAAWVVSDDGWHRMPGFDPFDEPARVRDLTDLTSGPAVASLVLTGAAPVADRDALGVVREPDGAEGLALAAHVVDLLAEEMTRLEEAVVDREGGGGDLDDAADSGDDGDPAEPDDAVAATLAAYATLLRGRPAGEAGLTVLARLVVGLQDRHVRDHLLALVIDPSHDPWDGSDPSEAIGRAVTGIDAARVRPLELAARLAPRSMAAPALTLLAVLAWRRGEGARSRVLGEQALEDTEGYALAGLVLDLLDAGCPPPLRRVFADDR